MIPISTNEALNIIQSILYLTKMKKLDELKDYYFKIKEQYEFPDFVMLDKPEDVYNNYKKSKKLDKLIIFNDQGLNINNHRVLLYFKRYYPNFMNLYQ